MLMTANPHYDAECHADAEARREAQAEALEIEAYGIALAALCSKQASWYKSHRVGDMNLTPDEMLYEALGNDTEVTDAFDALMTDAAPAAQKLREALASFTAKLYWRGIAGYPNAV